MLRGDEYEERILVDWTRFIRAGFDSDLFTDDIYKLFIGPFGFRPGLDPKDKFYEYSGLYFTWEKYFYYWRDVIHTHNKLRKLEKELPEWTSLISEMHRVMTRFIPEKHTIDLELSLIPITGVDPNQFSDLVIGPSYGMEWHINLSTGDVIFCYMDVQWYHPYIIPIFRVIDIYHLGNNTYRITYIDVDVTPTGEREGEQLLYMDLLDGYMKLNRYIGREGEIRLELHKGYQQPKALYTNNGIYSNVGPLNIRGRMS